MNSIEIKNFLTMTQLLNSSFPIGGFSHSNGLEYFVKSKDVTNESQMELFLKNYFEHVLIEFEAIAFLKAYDFGMHQNIELIKDLDSLVYAMKLSKESRSSSVKIGRAFYRMVLKVLDDESYITTINSVWQGEKSINYCVIAGFCCGLLQVNKTQALSSFLFYSINNILQAGIKLIPLGQSAGQSILHKFEDTIASAVLKIANVDSKNLNLCNFAPSYDIGSMNHEFLYTKLYMS